MIVAPILNKRWIKRLELNNPRTMLNTITDCDIVVSEYSQVEKIPTKVGKCLTVRELWESYDGIFFEKSSIDLLFQLIDKMHPEYSDSAREYFSGNKNRGYNCYIMKKEFFFELCQFQFDILFEVEKRISTEGYTPMMLRTPAYLGEILYGIFVYHLEKQGRTKIKTVQLAFFKETKATNTIFQKIWQYFRVYGEISLRAAFDPFFPLGSKRREYVKRCFFRLAHIQK